MATLDSSNILDGNTIEPTDIIQLYDALTPGGGTTGAYNVTVSGSLIGNASTATSSSYALSSSFATTASFALNASPTQLISQGYSNISAGPVEATFKFYAGTLRIISNSGTSANFPGLAGKTLGSNVWVTANIQGQASSFASDIVTVRSLSVNGAITIETNSVPDATEVYFHVIYVP